MANVPEQYGHACDAALVTARHVTCLGGERFVPDHHHVVPLDFSDDGEDEYDVLCGVQAVKDKM